MFLALSKTVDIALAPLTWALVLALLSALVARSRPGRGAALALGAAAVLYAFSAGPLPNLVVRAAESSVRSTVRPGAVYDAIVLLSGEVDIDASRASGELELDEAADRLVATYSLLREGRARNVLLSGGSSDPRPGEKSEAELVAETLRAWGVAPDRIVVEGRSRNTRENAVETAALVQARGWRSLLLVTSAFHAPRALGCFRQVGLAPDLLAVDHRVHARGATWLPRAQALERSTEAIRELAGRLVYWVTGYAG